MTALGMYNLTASDGAVSQFKVGTLVEVKGASYRYCQATAANISAYSICSGPNFGAVQAATTTTVNALGTAGGIAVIPQFDVLASEYFWALEGPFPATNFDGATTFKVLGINALAGALLYSTATAGVVDDDSSGTVVLNGLQLTSAVTSPAAATPCVAYRTLGWVK